MTHSQHNDRLGVSYARGSTWGPGTWTPQIFNLWVSVLRKKILNKWKVHETDLVRDGYTNTFRASMYVFAILEGLVAGAIVILEIFWAPGWTMIQRHLKK